jgi:hypothetical protein
MALFLPINEELLNGPRRNSYTESLIKNISLGGSMSEFLKNLENEVQLV